MARLTISGPDRKDEAYEFDNGTVTIGRDESNDIAIKDPALALRHLQIESTSDGRFKLIDLETQSGTEVNGKKVNSCVLEHRDRIYVGEISLLFEDSPSATRPKTRRIPILRPKRRIRLQPRRPVTAPPPAAEVETPASNEEVQHERDNLYRLLEINKLLSSEHNLKKLLEIIMDAVIEMAGAERGFLILKEQGSLVIKVARNFDRESIRKPEFKVSHSVAEEVLRAGKPIISADASQDLPAAISVAELKLRSLLCMPFRAHDRTLGCVYIDNRFEHGVFQEEDLPLLQGFADQAALAIENARLFEENQKRTAQLRLSKEEIERLNTELKKKVEKQYAELSKVTQDLISTRKDIALKHDFSQIIGKSRPMQQVFYLLDRVIDTDEPVFVHGESGTGKELVARAIHFNSARAKSGKFISENCSAIPDTLLESELFGHEKGAFTGAIASKPGLFELAHKGTLFLDEIGDMSTDMQKKLLRAIQEGEIRRVGGKDVIRVDVRMVSASNKDLADLIRTGHFREDLFYRLNVVKITLPPLRERKDDIPLLVEHLLDRLTRGQNHPAKKLDDVAFWYLQNYSWPGNVRELDNELRRCVALADDVITVDTLKDEIKAKDLFKPAIRIPTGTALKDVVKEAIEDVERKVITRVLEESGWKKTEAARLLAISRPTLDAKIEAYGITRGQPGPTR